MTSHDDILLQDLLDGRLEPAEEARLRTRLAEESTLQERWEELRSVQEWVRGYASDVEPPEDFLEAVRARIAASSGASGASAAPTGGSHTPPGRPRLMRYLTVAYAAAALLVVGFTIAYVAKGPTDSAPPATEMARKDRRARAPESAEDRGAMESAALREAHDSRGEAKSSEKDALASASEDATSAHRPPQGAAEDEPKHREGEEPENSRAKGAGGRSGYFSGPGGGVRPGMRAVPETPVPAETPAPPSQPQGTPPGRLRPPQPHAPAAPAAPASDAAAAPAAKAKSGAKEKPADRLRPAAEPRGRGASHPEVLFVLETRDAGAARKRLDRLLARLLEPDEEQAPLPAASKADAPEKQSGTAQAADASKPAGTSRGATHGTSRQPTERLVRVPAAQARMLASRLERKPEEARSEDAEGRPGGSHLVLRDTVCRTLPTWIIQRLEDLPLLPARDGLVKETPVGGSAAGRAKKAAPVRVKILILELTPPSK